MRSSPESHNIYTGRGGGYTAASFGRTGEAFVKYLFLQRLSPPERPATLGCADSDSLDGLLWPRWTALWDQRWVTPFLSPA